jgi:hypothetical protein
VLKATVFVTAEGKLSEEDKVTLLFIHEEIVAEEGSRVKTVLFEAPYL